MTNISTLQLFAIDGERAAQDLQEICGKRDTTSAEVVLDFSDVQRIDPRAIAALETLARRSSKGAATITLRGLNVNIYKVLKLAGLSSCFSIER